MPFYCSCYLVCPKPEFDAHAQGYNANKLKALAGASAEDFVAVKVQWLLRRLG